MRITLVGVSCAVVALAAAPSFAQSSPSGSSSSSSTNSTDSSKPSMQQSLNSDLEKAGFKDVSVSPGSFDVHATNSNGQKVMMVVSPDSVTELVAAPSSSSNGKATPSK